MEREKLINLVTKAQSGDKDAMNTLFSEFYNDVYNFAYKTLKDTSLAEDITQETFLEIVRTIDKLSEPVAFVSWMKKIAYHQCTRYFKKKKDVIVDEDEDGNSIFDTLEDEDSSVLPEEVAENEDFKNIIVGMVNELSEEQRSAVMLYYFDEMAVAKIAEIQEVSEGTVKSRLNYARKAMRKSVESYEQKHGIRLHGVGILPLLTLGFGDKALISQAGFLAAQQAVTAAGATSAAAGTAATVATTVTAKAGSALGLKIAAGAVAASLVVGGAVLGFNLLNKKEPLNSAPTGYISAGCEHLVALKNDGTVVATGNNDYGQCNVEGWTDIVAVCARGFNTIALKADGTVYAIGDNSNNQLDVEDWTDIVAIYSAGDQTIGVKSDGTTVGTQAGYENIWNISPTPDVSNIKNAEFIDALGMNVYFKDKETGVLYEPGMITPQEVEGYKDVQLVKQNTDIFAALTKDGTMVLDGESATNYDLSDWKDITDFDISCSNTVYSDIMNGEYVENSGCFFKHDFGYGTLHDPIISIFGVDKNGKVFYEDNNNIHDMSVADGWSYITDVVAGDIFCAGLKADGTVVIAGNNEEGNLDVSGFTDIKTK